MSEKSMRLRKLTALAVLTALAFAAVCLFRIPITSVEFLKYEPKDVIIAVAGFVFGPMAALAVTVAASFIELITISSTGLWGFLMNVLSSAAFAMTASFIYKKKKSAAGAVAGLLSGVVLAVGVMILWNWLVTPFYMGMSRESVAAMLVPVFLPFNLLKYGLSAAFTLIIYKPAIAALSKAKLVGEKELASEGVKTSAFVIAFGILAAASLILVILTLTGVI